MRAIRMSVATLIGVFLIGCSADQVILLNDDGSGEIEVRIVVSAPFAAYISDLNASYGAPPDFPIFEPEAIEAAFADEPGLELVETVVPRREELYLLIRFDSIDRVLADREPSVRAAIRFERTETFRRLAAQVDRALVEAMLEFAAVDPFIAESLLPPDAGMGPTEYRDYLSWALEEYEQDQPLDRVFRNAEVETRVLPSGAIIQIRGGQRNGDAVLYQTPLIEALTRTTPFAYSLVFQPR